MFDDDDTRIEFIVDRDSAARASVTIFNGLDEWAAVWVPSLIADATACNAWGRYGDAVPFLRRLRPHFEIVEVALNHGTLTDLWRDTNPATITLYRTRTIHVVPVLGEDRLGIIIESEPARAASLELFEKVWRISVAWIASIYGRDGLHAAYARFNALLGAYELKRLEASERGYAPFVALQAIHAALEATGEAETDDEVGPFITENPAPLPASATSAVALFCVECGTKLLRPGEQRYCAQCGAPVP